MSKTSAASPPLNWEQAFSLILNDVQRGSETWVDLDSALDRICAADTFSAISVPPFDNSSMDGYAVRADDVMRAGADVPVMLDVIGEAPAGVPFNGEVAAGTAVQIMTGAPLPAGADAVVRVEDTARAADNRVQIFTAVAAGTAVRRAGADTAAGDQVLGEGQQITPGLIALAASCNIADVPVYERPRVALAVGGDEVIPVHPNAALLPGQIFDSNSHMLLALFRRWGFEAEFLGRMPDSVESMLEFFERGSDFDFLITVGGVSMGEHDYIRPCLQQIGAREVFWKINQQPGGPMLFARAGNTKIFGLPGNPVSAYVCADLYVQSALRKSAGHRVFMPRRISATLLEPLKKPHRKVAFVRCELQFSDGGFSARSTGPQDSNRIRSIAGHDGYIVFPEAQNQLQSGDTVTVLVPDASRLGEAIARNA
jgi:molybdopterin molybdotransferase